MSGCNSLTLLFNVKCCNQHINYTNWNTSAIPISILIELLLNIPAFYYAKYVKQIEN